MIIPKTKFILSDKDFIIFLDVDGVLNSFNFADWRKTEEGKARRKYLESNYDGITLNELILLDIKAMRLLADIIFKTNAKVVISSTWRERSSPVHFTELFRINGIELPKNTIIGLTPVMDQIEEHKRGVEIETWMNTHVFKGSYLALDDDPPSLFLPGQPLHQTLYKKGLTPDDANKVISIINKNIK